MLILILLFYYLSILCAHGQFEKEKKDLIKKKINIDKNFDFNNNAYSPISVSFPLYGTVHHTAYWFADLYFGYPNPQRQSLIIDTGSSVMGFPCSDCLDRCGNHIDPPFNLTLSSSFYPITCLPGCLLCAYPQTSHSLPESTIPPSFVNTTQSDQCAYHIRYTEGSSLMGRWYEDKVWLNYLPFDEQIMNHTNVTLISVPFGCHSKETHLFIDQDASGILGLEADSRYGPQPFVTSILSGLINKKASLNLPPFNTGNHTQLASFHHEILRHQHAKTDNYTKLNPTLTVKDLKFDQIIENDTQTQPEFSICLSESGGIMTIGQPNTQYHDINTIRKNMSDNTKMHHIPSLSFDRESRQIYFDYIFNNNKEFKDLLGIPTLLPKNKQLNKHVSKTSTMLKHSETNDTPFEQTFYQTDYVTVKNKLYPDASHLYVLNPILDDDDDDDDDNATQHHVVSIKHKTNHTMLQPIDHKVPISVLPNNQLTDNSMDDVIFNQTKVVSRLPIQTIVLNNQPETHFNPMVLETPTEMNLEPINSNDSDFVLQQPKTYIFFPFLQQTVIPFLEKTAHDLLLPFQFLQRTLQDKQPNGIQWNTSRLDSWKIKRHYLKLSETQRQMDEMSQFLKITTINDTHPIELIVPVFNQTIHYASQPNLSMVNESITPQLSDEQVNRLLKKKMIGTSDNVPTLNVLLNENPLKTNHLPLKQPSVVYTLLGRQAIADPTKQKESDSLISNTRQIGDRGFLSRYYPKPSNLIQWTPFLSSVEEDGLKGSYLVFIDEWTIKSSNNIETIVPLPKMRVPFFGLHKYHDYYNGKKFHSGLIALVDSGTTLTYLPLIVYATVWTQLLNHLSTARQTSQRLRIDTSRGLEDDSLLPTTHEKGIIRVSGLSLMSMKRRLDTLIDNLRKDKDIIEHFIQEHKKFSHKERVLNDDSETSSVFLNHQLKHKHDAITTNLKRGELLLNDLVLLNTQLENELLKVIEQHSITQNVFNMEGNNSMEHNSATPRNLNKMKSTLSTHLPSMIPRALLSLIIPQQSKMFKWNQTKHRVKERQLAPMALSHLEEECWYLSNPTHDFQYFPDMRLRLTNNVVFIWRPQSYLYRKGNTKVYCSTIVSKLTDPSDDEEENEHADAYHKINDTRQLIDSLTGLFLFKHQSFHQKLNGTNDNVVNTNPQNVDSDMYTQSNFFIPFHTRVSLNNTNATYPFRQKTAGVTHTINSMFDDITNVTTSELKRRLQHDDESAVLGSSFFLNHDMIFHLGNWSMGIIEAICPKTNLSARSL